MVKLLNIIHRLGNKDNDIKYFSHLLPLDIKTVVEPFGGSFSVSRSFYKNDKYDYHINDSDPTLHYIYTHYKDYLKVVTELDEYYELIEDENEIKDFKNYIKKLNINKYIIDYIIDSRFYKNVVYKPTKTKIYNPNDIYILDNAIISNDDYLKIFDKYKDNEDAFLFLDPPYLFSNNKSYYSQTLESDMSQFLVEILNFMNSAKCKVMFVINHLSIIEWMFKELKKLNYMRTYQVSKNKTLHLVCCNY